MKAKLVNTTAIESASGFKSINLFHGDICAAKDELLVLSTHANPGLPPEGEVVDALVDAFGMDFSALVPVVTVGEQANIGTFQVRQASNRKEHPAKDVFMVRVPGMSSVEQWGEDPLQVYEEVAWTLFGSLAAFEQKEVFFKSMAMPLLGGMRGYPPKKIMEILLKKSATWLKVSQAMGSVNLYLFKADDVALWTDAMNGVLGRRSIDSAKNEVVRALRDEIMVLIDGGGRFGHKEMADLVKPIRSALAEKQICLQLICAFSRRLTEKIVNDILEERKLEKRGILAADIQTLAYKQVVAPWIVSHFHALRVFGNETIHAKPGVSYRPEFLQDDDLVSVLTSLRSVIQFYANW